MRDGGFDYRRAQMIESLRRAGIQDERVLQAMSEIPRHLFVGESWRARAYDDDVSINIGSGQTISQPRIVATMSEAARIEPDHKVLEIGTGSGYQAAVLSHLARFVFSIERIAGLAREAKSRIDQLAIENVSIKVMDGTMGWRAQGPFDAILVTAGGPEMPEPLCDQLANHGRLVVPVGPRDQQVLKVVQRRGDRFVESRLQDVCFVPLVGRYGWEPTQ